jgi:type I restriction-modification system DNA methylase subunit/restriction endonuclease S subunit
MATDHPSVQKLASVVKVVRDRLRKVGITDMDSMMHNVLFVAARMLDDATIKKLGIPPPLLWTNLIKKVNEKDNEGADKQFKNILDILDAKFGMKRFPYMLESMDDFVSIMKSYDDVDIHEAAKHTDVLGYIYEQHLSTGSGSGRDLGKFYTDRQITHYLTELLGSDVSSLGRPDSMCDATMGTGGFILSYIDLVHAKHPDIKWELMDLAGGDIDDKVAAIARLNVFLRTGKIFPMIRQRNTLKNDICDPAQPSERRTFNRLLMNIPFGVKGLTLADDCCPRVKEIVKAGTKSEPLFMALVCQLLAEGGKAAVIVPDGVLVNCSKQHDSMRKYLLDNFKVLRIIKMRGKFFMNTGIQPSVIVFERSGKTEEVEFWDVEKVASGELVEKCEMKVAREKFDASCSFDMRRYQEAVVVANPGGFPIVRLADVSNANNGKILSMAEIKSNPGVYPIMSGGRSYCGNYSKFNRDVNQISISKTGSSSGFIAWHEQKFWAADCFTLDVSEKCNKKFLYYILSTQQDVIYREYQRRGVMPHCYWSDISKISFPLPPLHIQEEIVTALDLIYNNAASAKVSAASIKAQMAAVMRSVGARGYEKKKLGDVLEDLRTGKNKSDLNEGDYPFYMSNGISQYVNTYQFDGEYVLTARCGSLNGSQYYVNGKFSASDFTYVLKPKAEVNSHYLYNILRWVDWSPYQTGTTMKGIRREILTNYEITVPTLPIQQEVLAILNEMEAELKVMEQMTTKAEQRAKYILDGYLSSS